MIPNQGGGKPDEEVDGQQVIPDGIEPGAVEDQLQHHAAVGHRRRVTEIDEDQPARRAVSRILERHRGAVLKDAHDLGPCDLPGIVSGDDVAVDIDNPDAGKIRVVLHQDADDIGVGELRTDVGELGSIDPEFKDEPVIGRREVGELPQPPRDVQVAMVLDRADDTVGGKHVPFADLGQPGIKRRVLAEIDPHHVRDGRITDDAVGIDDVEIHLAWESGGEFILESIQIDGGGVVARRAVHAGKLQEPLLRDGREIVVDETEPLIDEPDGCDAVLFGVPPEGVILPGGILACLQVRDRQRENDDDDDDEGGGGRKNDLDRAPGVFGAPVQVVCRFHRPSSGAWTALPGQAVRSSRVTGAIPTVAFRSFEMGRRWWSATNFPVSSVVAIPSSRTPGPT